MSIALTNILVPVDFSINTEAAVQRTIELSQSSISTIHLLHVKPAKNAWNLVLNKVKSGNLIGKDDHDDDIMQKLQELQEKIMETMPQSAVNICLSEGTVQDNILHVAKQISPNLIIIAKKSGSVFFKSTDSVNPDRLAKSSACPVLTILNGPMQNKIKNIVIPVRDFIPYRKIEWVTAFAKRDRAKIHVVTLQRKMAYWNTERNYLIETHGILKSKLTNAVEYQVLNGMNLPKATFDYAKHIGADMIIVNPFSETKISNLTGKHMGDLPLPSSKIQILSVEPYTIRHQKSEGNPVAMKNAIKNNVE